MIIGITGKSGSGKTTISNKLNKDEKYLVIDVDTYAHRILEREEVKQELSNLYGSGILEDGEINRKRLGEIVFTSFEETEKYNKYIWEYIKTELERQMQNKENIIIEWSLLPLTEYLDKCDIKILVENDINTRMERVMKRDNISEGYFMKREARKSSVQ